MYIRRVTRKNKDGSKVSYIQLAHNVWDSKCFWQVKNASNGHQKCTLAKNINELTRVVSIYLMVTKMDLIINFLIRKDH